MFSLWLKEGEVNLLTKARNIAGGVDTLIEWVGDGATVVSQELAQSRTEICLLCPLNQPGAFVTESVAKAVKAQMHLKNTIGLRTSGIKSLKSCIACDCWLPLKIWIPLENILPDDELRAKLDKRCWLLTEPQ